MSKLTDDLKTYLRIFNPHDFARIGEAKIYVTYEPQELGRMSRGAQYVIVGIDFDADPEGRWYNNGKKVFTLFGSGEDKAKARVAALDWAMEKYNIETWAKMPYRESWVEKSAFNRVMQKLENAKKESQ